MPLLAKLLLKRRLLVLLAVCTALLAAVITLRWNSQIALIINSINSGSSGTARLFIPALFIIVLTGITAYVKNCIGGYACEAMTHDLRMGYAGHFLSLPAQETERLNTGRELSKLQNEIADISSYLNNNLFQLVDDGIRFITAAAWLFYLNYRLTLIIMVPASLIIIYVFHSSKIISNAVSRSQETKGRMNVFADTFLTLFPVVKLYDAAGMMISNYDKNVSDWEFFTVKYERVRARLMSLSGLFQCIPLMLLFWAGGGMAMAGDMSSDILSSGSLYVFVNLSGSVTGVMMNMPGFIAAFRQFYANLELIKSKISLDGDKS
ncbi:MAG: ABC transporter ATP-binding protein [Treponema sp.]|nr:ABC transporter ATP-binding protein [Treponema sp.]